MHTGRHCRTLSKTADQQIGRTMGNRSIDEFTADMANDAANPDQLDALAFQLLCAARSCRIRGVPEFARRWKEASRRVSTLTCQARARLAAIPTRQTHPGFFDRRSAGRPGCLDCDLFLPFAFRLHLGQPALAHATYEPELVDGAVYRVRGGRDLKTWLEPVDGGRTFPVANSLLRGLTTMGLIEALPLSAVATPTAA